MFDSANPQYYPEELDALETLTPILQALEVAKKSIHEAAQARADAKYWREWYMDDLSRQIKHDEAMMGNVLRAIIDKSAV